MATWHNLESARAEWLGAPKGDGTLQNLLDVARAEVVAYAPALDPEAVEPADTEDEDGPEVQSIPDGYRWAHLSHARNVWNSANVNPSGSFGADEGSFSMSPFPLDWAIKARLRPVVLFGGVVA
jgi:hypothetical protein